jgi:hypothetical protein
MFVDQLGVEQAVVLRRIGGSVPELVYPVYDPATETFTR